MPPRRASTRISASSTPAKASNGTPKAKPAHKRQLSSNSANMTPIANNKKRVKVTSTTSVPVKTTPKKSQYFKTEDSTESKDEEEDPEESQSADDHESSGYEEPTSASPSPSASEDEASDDSFEGRGKGKPKRARKNGSGSKGSSMVSVVIEKGKELWREGVKAGLGPGKQVFIEKPKPRGDGGIKFVDDRIHPNTFAFLGDLKGNNDREWFKMHEADYKSSWNDWTSFIQSITEKVVEIDETVPELPPKDLFFRVYRDVRFSSDKTPYKTYFSAAWSRTGRKGPYAVYYVQIAPGKSFVGSGLWMPDAVPLARLRQSVDRRPHELKGVLMDPVVRKEIFGGVKDDEKKAVQAFVAQNAENALKTKPKDYAADHPNIELLRLRNYTIGRKLKDEEVIGAKGLECITGVIAAMVPFVQFLNSVVMPDDEDDSSQHNDSDHGE